MTTIRASKLFEFRALLTIVVVVAAATGGCGAAPAVSGPANEPRPSGVRHPDGIALEPPAALPKPVERAAARGVVSLREPVDRAAVARLVQSFFDAWQGASLNALVALLTSDAAPIDGRGALPDLWRQRLQAHDYGRLAGLELFRAERIERWTWDELDAPFAPARPVEMQPDEVYVRVPVEVTHVGGERLFGDVAVLVLRREGGELRIASYGELEL